MSRFSRILPVAALLLVAACSRSPSALASTTAPQATKASASTPVSPPSGTVSGATPPQGAAPAPANSADSALLAPGRPRKLLVHAASEMPAIVPIGSQIPDGPVALPDAPRQNCTDPRPTACNLDYKPVCADVDTGVRCITTPCPSSERKTFGSDCKACRDPKVTAYVSGTCPKG